ITWSFENKDPQLGDIPEHNPSPGLRHESLTGQFLEATADYFAGSAQIGRDFLVRLPDLAAVVGSANEITDQPFTHRKGLYFFHRRNKIEDSPGLHAEGPFLKSFFGIVKVTHQSAGNEQNIRMGRCPHPRRISNARKYRVQGEQTGLSGANPIQG